MNYLVLFFLFVTSFSVFADFEYEVGLTRKFDLSDSQTSFLGSPAVNDSGRVAYIARDYDSNSNIQTTVWVADPGSDPLPLFDNSADLYEFPASSEFRGVVGVDNDGDVLYLRVKKEIPGVPTGEEIVYGSEVIAKTYDDPSDPEDDVPAGVSPFTSIVFDPNIGVTPNGSDTGFVSFYAKTSDGEGLYLSKKSDGLIRNPLTKLILKKGRQYQDVAGRNVTFNTIQRISMNDSNQILFRGFTNLGQGMWRLSINNYTEVPNQEPSFTYELIEVTNGIPSFDVIFSPDIDNSGRCVFILTLAANNGSQLFEYTDADGLKEITDSAETFSRLSGDIGSADGGLSINDRKEVIFTAGRARGGFAVFALTKMPDLEKPVATGPLGPDIDFLLEAFGTGDTVSTVNEELIIDSFQFAPNSSSSNGRIAVKARVFDGVNFYDAILSARKLSSCALKGMNAQFGASNDDIFKQGDSRWGPLPIGNSELSVDPKSTISNFGCHLATATTMLRHFVEVHQSSSTVPLSTITPAVVNSLGVSSGNGYFGLRSLNWNYPPTYTESVSNNSILRLNKTFTNNFRDTEASVTPENPEGLRNAENFERAFIGQNICRGIPVAIKVRSTMAHETDLAKNHIFGRHLVLVHRAIPTETDGLGNVTNYDFEIVDPAGEVGAALKAGGTNLTEVWKDAVDGQGVRGTDDIADFGYGNLIFGYRFWKRLKPELSPSNVVSQLSISIENGIDFVLTNPDNLKTGYDAINNILHEEFSEESGYVTDVIQSLDDDTPSEEGVEEAASVFLNEVVPGQYSINFNSIEPRQATALISNRNSEGRYNYFKLIDVNLPANGSQLETFDIGQNTFLGNFTNSTAKLLPNSLTFESQLVLESGTNDFDLTTESVVVAFTGYNYIKTIEPTELVRFTDPAKGDGYLFQDADFAIKIFDSKLLEINIQNADFSNLDFEEKLNLLLVINDDLFEANIFFPEADAGADQLNADLNSLVQLDGNNSRSNTESIASWQVISQPAGSNISLNSGSTLTPSFTPEVSGEYKFSLTLENDQVKSFPDEVSVFVDVNFAPIAIAGDDLTDQAKNQFIQLDGSSSSDLNTDDVLTFSWVAIDQPQGSNVTINSPNTAQPSISVDKSGSYEFELSVSDGIETSTDTVLVSFINNAPTISTVPLQYAQIDTGFGLQAAYSDQDNDSVTFFWELLSSPVGSNPVISGPNNQAAGFQSDVFGDYQIRVTVTDNDGASASALKTVNVYTVPKAVIPGAPGYFVGDLVILDGSGSFTEDNRFLTYEWSFDQKPVESNAQINDPTAATTSFTADFAGVYVAQLVVRNDLGIASAPEFVEIVVDENQIPIANIIANANVRVGGVLALDGSNSFDPEDGPVTGYAWSFTSKPVGSAAVINNPASAQADFMPDVEGNYSVALVVTDSRGEQSEPAEVLVSAAENVAPVIQEIGPQTLAVGQGVLLFIPISDANDDQLTVTLDTSDAPVGNNITFNPDFNIFTYAPKPGEEGDFTITVTADDGLLQTSQQFTVTAVSAQPYNFTRIADTTNFTAFDNNGKPAINAVGQVVFSGTDTSVTSGIFLSDGSNLSNISAVPSSFENINDAGEVVFTTDNGSIVRKYAGGATSIVKDAATSRFTEFFGAHIANDGMVTYKAQTDDTTFGVYAASNDNFSLIDFEFPTILDAGIPTIANFGNVSAIRQQGLLGTSIIFDGATGARFYDIYLATQAFAPTSPLAEIDDQIDIMPNFGFTAVWAKTIDNIEAILSATRGFIVVVMDTVGNNGQFQSFKRTASITDNFTTAFLGNLSTGGHGIFTSAGESVDFNPSTFGVGKVIQTGDALDGSTVTALDFFSDGINNSYQVAFYAELADGRKGIYRADPGPLNPAPVCEPNEVKAIDAQGNETLYSTIQSAIDVATTGWTIEVGEGTFPEYLTIRDKVGVVLRTTCNATIDGVFVENNSDVTIDGFTIDASNTNTDGVRFDKNKDASTNIELKNCNISGAVGTNNGVAILKENINIVISDCVITNNNANGIYTEGPGGPYTIRGNTITANGRNGVDITGGANDITLVDNSITGNGLVGPDPMRYGVYRQTNGAAFPEQIALVNNQITGNAGQPQGTSSADLGNFDLILDATTDSGNYTTAGNEGPGVQPLPLRDQNQRSVQWNTLDPEYFRTLTRELNGKDMPKPKNKDPKDKSHIDWSRGRNR